ncbi:MAG: branched-chain amino acid ABC transporter permease [Deltaproteobacteria bacterium]|nr:branched-chain amino acid ABC transporter permease [Deltaproteobacteria bacterium]MBW2283530.1 branched-chain amino acid ABC transporter permease [Deltaproteobacteria bacterium]
MGLRKWLLLLCVLAALLTAPLYLGAFWLSLFMQVLIFGLLALSVELILGHAGMFSFCQAAFFAVSAYTVAILQVKYGQPTIVAVPAGLLSAVVLSLLYGVAVRTSGVYFILVTIALGHIVWGVAWTWVSFTNGEGGISNIPDPAIGSLTLSGHFSYYYVVLAVVGLCMLGYRILIRSPFALTLHGLRESESRMRALGYHTGAHKYLAFVLAGTLSGVAGILYAYFNRFVSPASAEMFLSIEAALMVLVGGTGTIIGPFIGSAIILGIRYWVSAYITNWMIIMGVVFIVTMLWTPDGILGVIRRIQARLSGTRDQAGHSEETAGGRE